jgi:tRNA1(Val) A37 N6-methylase TrmN6
MDIDPIVEPDIVADAWAPPFGKDSFDVVILDPPYNHINAATPNRRDTVHNGKGCSTPNASSSLGG